MEPREDDELFDRDSDGEDDYASEAFDGADPYWDYDDEKYLIDGVGFADPGGRSALRAATAENPRCCPCPTCGRQNVLTPLDVRAGYQCDRCADAAEGGGP